VLEIIILSWYFAMNEDKLAPNVIHISKKEFLIYLEAENINNAKRERKQMHHFLYLMFVFNENYLG
jgi:hypothetical protein